MILKLAKMIASPSFENSFCIFFCFITSHENSYGRYMWNICRRNVIVNYITISVKEYYNLNQSNNLNRRNWHKTRERESKASTHLRSLSLSLMLMMNSSWLSVGQLQSERQQTTGVSRSLENPCANSEENTVRVRVMSVSGSICVWVSESVSVRASGNESTLAETVGKENATPRTLATGRWMRIDCISLFRENYFVPHRTGFVCLCAGACVHVCDCVHPTSAEQIVACILPADTGTSNTKLAS